MGGPRVSSPIQDAPPPPFAGGLPVRGTAVLFALAAALLLFRLGDVPLLGPDEPRYARVAVEMQRSGDWVTPTLQGQPWLEKPALYYWLAGIGYRVFGETELPARLPSVLAGIVMVATTALVGARLYGGPAGLQAGFVLATSVLFFGYGKAASMDMLLAAAVTVAIGLAGMRQLGVSGPLGVAAAWGAAGVGLLAKGPLGLLLPLLVFGVHHAVRRDFRGAVRLFSWRGLLLLLLIAGPWYLLVTLAQGQAFVDTFLLNHNVARFTSTVHKHPGSPAYYLPVLLGGFFPWTAVLLPGIARALSQRTTADRFVLVWAAAPLVFFSSAGSKLPGYILPCLPPLALLMGRALAEAVPSLTWTIGARVTLALAAVIAAAPPWLGRQGEPAWTALLPAGLWVLATAFLFTRQVGRSLPAAAALLRLGAAGFLLLLALAAPPILDRWESGRAFFVPAQGREVLVWNARRTAWMAGYFYNDGRVREVSGLADIHAAAGAGPVLVLCGPAEQRAIARVPRFAASVLAEGLKENALLEIRTR